MNKPNNVEKRASIEKLTFYVALTSLFIVSVVNIVRDQTEQVMAETEESEDLENSPMDFVNYNPPSDYGSVIERNFVPNNKKTIIYILDSHPMTMEDKESLDVQRDLYFIFKDFIDNYGVLPMVIENWPIGAKTTDFNVDYFSDDSDPYFGNGLLKAIVREDDYAKKRIMVESNLGQTIVPAGMLAMLAYPELEPIGSVNQRELESINRSIQDMKFAQFALESPNIFPCNEDGSFTLRDARESFEESDLSEEVLQCYCGIRGYLSYTMPAFFNDRFVQAPQREMSAAMNYDGEVVVVVAGMNHLPQSLKIMKEEDLNYIIVSPNSIDSKVPRVLDDLPVIENLPDDTNESCERFQESLRVKKNEEFVEWFIEDEGIELNE